MKFLDTAFAGGLGIGFGGGLGLSILAAALHWMGTI